MLQTEDLTTDSDQDRDRRAAGRRRRTALPSRTCAARTTTRDERYFAARRRRRALRRTPTVPEAAPTRPRRGNGLAVLGRDLPVVSGAGAGAAPDVGVAGTSVCGRAVGAGRGADAAGALGSGRGAAEDPVDEPPPASVACTSRSVRTFGGFSVTMVAVRTSPLWKSVRRT